MSLLPFKVSPKAIETVDVGNDEIGVLSIPKLKDLSPLERRYIKSQNLFDFQKQLASLAKRISKASGAKFAYTNDRIYGYIFDIGVITEDVVTVISDDKAHKSLKGKTATVIKIEKTENGKVATIKLEDKEITIDADLLEIVDPEWFGEFYSEIITFQNEFLASLETQKLVEVTAILLYRLKLEDWTLEHTSNPELIRSELVNAIAEFIVKEKAHWVEVEPVEFKESTDEELGKSSAA
jgi:hypothetical protein